MKLLFTLTAITGFALSGLSQQKAVIIALEPNQSMSISGKGLGQDAAINPYADIQSVAILENLGSNRFSVRIQKAGKIISVLNIEPKESKEVPLEADQELYFDSYLAAKTSLRFRPADKQ